MSWLPLMRVAFVVIGATGIVVAAARRAGSHARRAPAWPSVIPHQPPAGAGGSASPLPPIARDERRMWDSVVARRDSLLDLNRFAVLAVGRMAHEFDVHAVSVRSVGLRGEPDTVLVRVVHGRDTLTATARRPVRVRPPALLLLAPGVRRFTLSTGDPTRAVELRPAPRPSSSAQDRPLWTGPLQGWRMTLRRAGRLGEFVPEASAVALVPAATR